MTDGQIFYSRAGPGPEEYIRRPPSEDPQSSANLPAASKISVIIFSVVCYKLFLSFDLNYFLLLNLPNGTSEVRARVYSSIETGQTAGLS